MFILCTTELHKVLPTIVSRCQRHSFKRIEPEAIAGRLSYVAEQEGLDLTAEAAGLLARLADGGMRDALSLLDQCSGAEHIDIEAVHSAMGLAGSRRIVELLDSICARQPDKALELFGGLWKDGKDPAGILGELGDLMRDILLLQMAPRSADALLSGVYDKSALERFAAKLSASELMDGMKAIRDADISGQNPRRAAEMCLVSLCEPESGESLAALRSRIARLEAAVKNGVPAAPDAPAPAAYAPAFAPAEKKQTPPPPPAEDIPWYTDDNAPPEEPVPWAEPAPAPEPVPEPVEERPAPEPVPEPVSPAPMPAPAGSAGDVWEELVGRLQGKMDMGTYAMITTSSQTSGELAGDTMTVYLSSPIAKMMLNTPTNVALLQAELAEITGKTIHVAFADGKSAAPAAPDTGKLDALSRFSNVKFE